MFRHSKKFSLLALGCICLFNTEACNGETIAWRTPAGEISTIDVYPDDTFFDVISQMKHRQRSCCEYEFLIDFSTGATCSNAAQTKSPFREYQPLTSGQKRDIEFIILTLGNGSLASIASSRSSIKKAGDRIESVHPFKMLMHVFSDEKLKAAMHNLRGRTLWIWSEFFNGIKGSLDEESERNNVVEFINDFSKSLQIDASLISPLIIEKRWKEFINELFTLIPRQGNTDRYNL